MKGFPHQSVSDKSSKHHVSQVQHPGIFVDIEELSRLSLLAQRNIKKKKIQTINRLGGQYHSSHKGRGLEYAETRTYEPGDDVRHIDWRVTARTERPHTKLFREERERPLMLLVDCSRSMYFGTRQRLKSVQAMHGAAILGWEALFQGDRVGSMCLGDNGILVFKPKGTRKHFLQQLYQLADYHNQQLNPLMEGKWCFQQESIFHEGLARLVKSVSPGSMIRVISDGSGLDEKSRMHLNRLCLHNEVHFTLIHDPLELNLPHAGRFRVRDGDHEAWLEGGTSKQRENYQKQSQEYMQGLELFLRNLKVSFERLSTADNLADWATH
ncbi:MAG TPA: DUF58 domain-containing protein [SAR324 cluster bacterium]|jgi:uncharacterized protein (DUF58 family)|nr:DUF58 domain-containing protein [Deltaproteobacteria bacterium]MDP6090464.1 DUF58 domain-containing protein [SAR324 cluster bacterium]MDP7127878.1 DUF58 domain-containing protein [Candidatus Neomarinimicrobiota bacterium]MBP44147.1 DUF58 domain-containing protein [Deltaproteobacteria bacterium]MDP6245060.1 DUF58 domain-containing protein [SAR324 cluster bacterium]|tara:strand:+ start:1165 stop:2139 length:975 start_codon:yes stop_codon:yes gene_type:complete